jgi:two-component system response regulator CpxR
VLRRYEPRDASAPAGRLEINGVALDPGTREVLSNGRALELTTFEFDILELLMRNAGRVLSRDALMENFYNRKSTPFDRSIDMHISHLRKKLDRGENLIKTIRGVGYQFSRTPEDALSE